MDNGNPIDTTFDFRLDTPQGEDPDTSSPTLCRYHKLLWSRPLPRGRVFDLACTRAPFYLRHSSELGEFLLSSDTVIPTFKKQKKLASVFGQIPEEKRNFGGLGYTIGGMMVFPAKQVDKKWTINQARGCAKKIRDRFDLTLECIRRHYSGGESPLNEVLARYTSFFDLFGDFRGYVDFFLLQDLVDGGSGAVRFFSPFDDFKSSPVPSGVGAYLEYRDNAIDFLTARNNRIREWSEIHLSKPAE